MPKIVKRKDKIQSSNGKIHINFDIAMLNALIKYTRCVSWVKRPQLDTLLKLMQKLDFESYNYNEDAQIRISFITAICEGIILENITDSDVLEMYVKDHVPDCDSLLNDVGFTINQLNKSECDTITKAISERLQFAYLYSFKNTLLDLYDEIDKPGFVSYYDTVDKFKKELTEMMVKLQSLDVSDEMVREFNFAGYLYNVMMDKIIARAKRGSTILFSGMRCLNALLNPGFEGGRLYLFLGATGKGKSVLLLNLADQLRLFNPQIKPVENGIRKTVVLVTMENTINETIERLFSMYNDTGIPLKYLDPEEIKKILRDKGKFSFSDDAGIDLDIFYFNSLEISTSHLYNIVYKLQDIGKEPIALILDYILEIESAHDNQNDERLRLIYTGAELKSFAIAFDIPVITAMQFNRAGNEIIDAGCRDGKDGILKFVGPAYIGTAWGLTQKCDFVGGINLEKRRSTNTFHMSFIGYKTRVSDAMSINYFNHPFVSNDNIRLIPDVDKEKAVSIILSASDLEGVNPDDNDSVQSRPSFKDKIKPSAPPNTDNRITRLPLTSNNIPNTDNDNSFRQIA